MLATRLNFGRKGSHHEAVNKTGSGPRGPWGGGEMSSWMINAVSALVFLLAATGIFFFVATRGALIVRGLSRAPRSSESHVYPIYSNMRLIKMVDFQPIISAILLFQYHRLVSKIVAGLRTTQPEAQEGADHLVCLRQRDPARGGSLARIGRRAHRDRRHHPERADACQEQAHPARTQDRVHRGRRDRDDAEGRLRPRQRHVLPAARTAARPQGQGAERSRPHAGPRRQAVPGRIPQADALGPASA